MIYCGITETALPLAAVGENAIQYLNCTARNLKFKYLQFDCEIKLDKGLVWNCNSIEALFIRKSLIENNKYAG